MHKFEKDIDPDEYMKIEKFSMKVFLNSPFFSNKPPTINLKVETLIYLITLANMKKDYLMRNLINIISTAKDKSPSEEQTMG